jgi:hypothetical protein
MAKPNAQALLRKGVSSIADWLDEIPNAQTFNDISWFLLKSGIFTEKMYGSIS